MKLLSNIGYKLLIEPSIVTRYVTSAPEIAGLFGISYNH
jgi:hypothetical protein